MPTDLTEGACDALAKATSKETLLPLWSALGVRCFNMSISLINLLVNVLKSSALFLEADTTKNFKLGLRNKFQQTKALQIQDLPAPRNACITLLRGAFCKKSAISYWTGVGSIFRCFHTKNRKFLKSRVISLIDSLYFRFKRTYMRYLIVFLVLYYIF